MRFKGEEVPERRHMMRLLVAAKEFWIYFLTELLTLNFRFSGTITGVGK